VIVHRVRDFGRSRRQPSPLAIRASASWGITAGPKTFGYPRQAPL
jgi:hypothetical protein